MKKLLLIVLTSYFYLSLIGCSKTRQHLELDNTEKFSTDLKKTLTAQGVGKVRKNQYVSIKNQYELAKQAAKIKAYRELAKQLYSEKVTSNFSVADQVIGHEKFRVYTDLYIRNAKETENNTIFGQTSVTLELILSSRFYYCLSSLEGVNQCLLEDQKEPFTRVGYQVVPVSNTHLGCMDTHCFSQFSVSGFTKQKNTVDRAMLDYGLYDSEWIINMALKSAFRYFVLTRPTFN